MIDDVFVKYCITIIPSTDVTATTITVAETFIYNGISYFDVPFELGQGQLLSR